MKMKDIIFELESYVTIAQHEINTAIFNEIVKCYPQAIHEGIAYQSIYGEWNFGYSNLSWSISKDEAIRVCKSFKDEVTESKIYLYEANIYGINLEVLVKLLIEDGHQFSQNFLSLALKEKEVLALEFNQLLLVDTF